MKQETEPCEMTNTAENNIKLILVWPKYRFMCGQLTRILTDRDTPERLIGSRWHPDQG